MLSSHSDGDCMSLVGLSQWQLNHLVSKWAFAYRCKVHYNWNDGAMIFCREINYVGKSQGGLNVGK